MPTKVTTAAIVLAACAVAAPAAAQPRWQDGLLRDEAGVPLYVSNAEPPGTSQCYGACLNIWTPYAAPADAQPSGEHTLVRRDDGTLMWAWKGKPLYRWWDRTKPLDGDGMRGGNWHLVRQP